MISCQPLPGFAQLVADRAAARALGDDRPERRRLGCSLDHHLAADREADAADPIRIDVGPALQVRDGGVDVALALPAEQVRVALALALAATVEEQHAVAVPCEELRTLAARTNGPGNEITAAPFRDGMYQPSSSSPSLVVKCDVLVGRAEVGRRDVCASRVRDDVRDRNGEQDGERDEQRADGEQQPPRRSATRARSSRRRDLHSVTPPSPSKSEPGEDRQQPGVVVARRADRRSA